MKSLKLTLNYRMVNTTTPSTASDSMFVTGWRRFGAETRDEPHAVRGGFAGAAYRMMEG